MAKLITFLCDQNLNFPEDKNKVTDFFYRKAARAILINDKNQIALMHVSKSGYHKLPGGGIDEGETVEEGLKRELLEETGCNAEIEKFLGITLEMKEEIGLMQVSYAFVCKVIGEPGEVKFTESELEHGFEFLWVDADKIVELMENDRPIKYNDIFIVKRDLSIIKRYMDNGSIGT